MSQQHDSSGSRQGLRFRIAYRSDVGKLRTENQDFGLVTTPAEWDPADGVLMLVADGMGGHRGGATASRLAARTILTTFLERKDQDTAGALVEAIEAANAKVFAESGAHHELRGMGTTASAMVVRGERAFVAHVGDSRIYRLRDAELTQLTEDHSLVATMVREGLLTDAEAAVHPRRNVLQRSLGVGPEIEVDRLEQLDIHAGDVYLLCSDGLHGFVPLEQVQKALELPVEEAAARCIQLAHEAGAPDNVTVVICRADAATGGERSVLPERTLELPPPTGERGGSVSAFRWIWIGLLVGAAGAVAWLWSDLRAALSRPGL
ncbi:MAG TPA: Stp1/IreP family PP2C-type Ser/Thr phosphatase [Thermoanaerobaculia bacterium]|nr:Stp1/IreP family PP2C-type Ser/Thr phosphatase [Thermoanaerobaculia bacterium]